MYKRSENIAVGISLQVCGINDQCIWQAFLGHQTAEYPIENAQFTPTNKTVVQVHGRPIISWRIAPSKVVSDNVDDGAHYTTVINTRNAVRNCKKWLIRSGYPNGQNKVPIRDPPSLDENTDHSR